MPYRRSVPVFALVALAVLCLPLLDSALPVPAGEARLISDPSPFFNSQPTLAAASQGRFLSVWNDARNGLKGRFVNAVGVAAGPETLLVANSPFPAVAGDYPYLINEQPSLVALGPGQGFLLVFVQETGTLRYSYFHADYEVASHRVLALRLDAAGHATGAPVNVGTRLARTQDLPAAVRGGDGSVLVSWQERVASEPAADVRGRLYAPATNGFGPERALSGTPGAPAAAPRTVATPEGGYLVAWTGFDADGTGILARRFDAQARPLGPAVQVNEVALASQYGAAVVGAAGGGYLVGWQTAVGPIESRLFVRHLDAAGQPAGGELGLSDDEATHSDSALTLAALDDGGFMAFWLGWYERFPAWVLGQELTAEGAPLGGLIEVSSSRPLSQRSLAVAQRNGNLFVAWDGTRGRAKAVAARGFEQRGGQPLGLRVAPASGGH